MSKRLDKLEEKFLNTIKENNLITKGDKIVVGVSGGPDSITLLACLNKYKEKYGYEIIVAHVNHLIREDSTEDEQFVENACEKMNVKCYVKRVEILKIASENKNNVEETGRNERYKFFDEIAEKENANKIAIAHNMNDNAETMLMNLIRGCGLNGLEGIQALEYDKYIRPLINCSREEIEAYCEKNELNPRIDYTNKENIYKRNKIRNELIPYLKELNPNIVQNLSRISKIIKNENEYINKQVENIYNKISNESLGNIEIDLKKFNEQEIAIKEKLVLYTIDKVFGSTKNIEKINIDDIIKMCQKNVGNKYIIPNKNIKIFIQNKKIIFMPLA